MVGPPALHINALAQHDTCLFDIRKLATPFLYVCKYYYKRSCTKQIHVCIYKPDTSNFLRCNLHRHFLCCIWHHITEKHHTCTTLGNFTIIPSLLMICREAPRPSFVTFGIGLNISAVVALVIQHSAVVFVRLWQNNWTTTSYMWTLGWWTGHINETMYSWN